MHLHPPLMHGTSASSVIRGHFETPQIRHDEIAVFLEDVDPELPAIVVGDFNEGDDGSVVAYLRQRGLASALAGFDGDADTWRWTTSVGTLHRQLDHIEHDDRLVAVAGRVLPGGNSDHLAVVADFVVDVATQPAARLP